MLQKGALAAAQQALIDNLALAKAVFQTVAGEAAGQAPAHAHGLNHFGQRLEPSPGRVLQARQLVKHHAVEVQRLLAQPLQVVVVRHHHRRLGQQRLGPLGRRAHAQGKAHARRPFGLLDWPDVSANALGGQHQPTLDHALAQGVAHGRERDGGLARAHWRQHHRPVVLKQEVGRVVLVRAQVHLRDSSSISRSM